MAMRTIFRHTAGSALTDEEKQTLQQTEWLVTNGLGGYASGTAAGMLTRVFHGYLIAALPAPLGRVMMLNDIVETALLPNGASIQLTAQRTADADYTDGLKYLASLQLEGGLPVWTYELPGVTLEKRLV